MFLEILLKELEGLNKPPGEVWFRGHSDANWELIPSLLRSPLGINQETNILARFRNRAMGMMSTYPTDNDPARWLFLMQHYGLPTRLLDWTESALAGLFFAVAEHDDRDGALYLLSPIEFNNYQTGKPAIHNSGTDKVQNFLTACFKGTEKPPETLAFLAYASNDRISRQQGQFTIHGSSNDLRKIAQPEWLRTIHIPAKSKPQIRLQLSYFGVTRTSLFYDLESLATDIKKQHGFK